MQISAEVFRNYVIFSHAKTLVRSHHINYLQQSKQDKSDSKKTQDNKDAKQFKLLKQAFIHRAMHINTCSEWGKGLAMDEWTKKVKYSWKSY